MVQPQQVLLGLLAPLVAGVRRTGPGVLAGALGAAMSGSFLAGLLLAWVMMTNGHEVDLLAIGSKRESVSGVLGARVAVMVVVATGTGILRGCMMVSSLEKQLAQGCHHPLLGTLL